MLRFWKAVTLSSLLFAVPAASAVSAMLELTVEANRYPFMPRLLRDETPNLCSAFLTLVQGQFLRPAFEISIAETPWPILHDESPEWVIGGPREQTDEADGIQLDDAGVIVRRPDLNNDGTPEVLAEFVRSHSWRGEWHSLILYPSVRVFDWLIEKDRNLDQIMAGGIPIIQDSWKFLNVARYGDAFYLYDEGWTTDYDRPTLSLLRLASTGKLHESCTVQILPTSQEQSRLAGLSSLTDFYDLTAAIGGGEGDCGTLRANTRQQQRAAATRSRAIFRPWTLVGTDDDPRSIDPYNARKDVDAFLFRWGYQSLSQHRLWRQLRQSEEAAAAVLAVHYNNGFGLDVVTAAHLGKFVTDRVLRWHFVFPADSDRELDEWDRNIVQTGDRVGALKRSITPVGSERTRLMAALLRRAALDGRDGDVEWLLQTGVPADALENEPSGRESYGAGDAGETALFAALQHPEIVRRLIAAKADVNRANVFGKTPLMYAAQYDLVESAKLLLSAGANPNSTTKTLSECYYSVRTGSRTALTYAAESASLDMLRLLISKGAEVTATDSHGNGVAGYLQKNSFMAADELRVVEGLLKGQSQ